MGVVEVWKVLLDLKKWFSDNRGTNRDISIDSTETDIRSLPEETIVSSLEKIREFGKLGKKGKYN